MRLNRLCHPRVPVLTSFIVMGCTLSDFTVWQGVSLHIPLVVKCKTPNQGVYNKISTG